MHRIRRDHHCVAGIDRPWARLCRRRCGRRRRGNGVFARPNRAPPGARARRERDDRSPHPRGRLPNENLLLKDLACEAFGRAAPGGSCICPHNIHRFRRSAGSPAEEWAGRAPSCKNRKPRPTIDRTTVERRGRTNRSSCSGSRIEQAASGLRNPSRSVGSSSIDQRVGR